MLQRLIDETSETRSMASANPYYTHPCRTFGYITPCSVFTSVLLLLYLLTTVVMKGTNNVLLRAESSSLAQGAAV